MQYFCGFCRWAIAVAGKSELHKSCTAWIEFSEAWISLNRRRASDLVLRFTYCSTHLSSSSILIYEITKKNIPRHPLRMPGVFLFHRDFGRLVGIDEGVDGGFDLLEVHGVALGGDVVLGGLQLLLAHP